MKVTVAVEVETSGTAAHAEWWVDSALDQAATEYGYGRDGVTGYSVVYS